MKEKVLKINEKNFNLIKNLNDKDFGTLVKSLCTYVYYGKIERPTDKVLQVYFDMFKEKIDRYNYFREKGKLGSIKSKELRQQTNANRSVVFDICKVGSLDELFKAILKDGLSCSCNKPNVEEEE